MWQEPPALQPMLSLAIAAKLDLQGRHEPRGRRTDAEHGGANDRTSASKSLHPRMATSTLIPASIMPDEVLEGDFQGGGDTLNFKDGRPPLRNVCMRRVDLDKAIGDIRTLYNKPAL